MQTNYMVWYRPQGSVTWTTWSEGNFTRIFLKEETAREYIKQAKAAFTNEFCVFQATEMPSEVALDD